MSGSGLRLYYDLMSQPSRALYIFVKLTKIPFESKPVALRQGEHLGEEYGKINPFHLVPAIDDNGFKLTESVAILKYLSVKYNVADHWYPRDLQQRAIVDSYMAWQHMNLRLAGGWYFRTKIIIPRQDGKPANPAELTRLEGELEIALDKIELIYLKSGSGFLCGPEISVADLLGICELMQPLASGYDVFKNRPRLEGWAKRVRERIGAGLFDEAHAFLYRVRDQFAKNNPSASKL